jgi:hypothetical protein
MRRKRPSRTGLRKPRNHLKQWAARAWTKQLTPGLRVGRVDEDLPVSRDGERKSWYLVLTQRPDLLKELGPVDGLPDTGTTLLLFEDDVVALVRYLLEPQVAAWAEDPEATKLGRHRLFFEPGLVAFTEAGEAVNGEAHWSPEHFRQARPLDARAGLPTRKVHTLPWPMNTAEPERQPANKPSARKTSRATRRRRKRN